MGFLPTIDLRPWYWCFSLTETGATQQIHRSLEHLQSPGDTSWHIKFWVETSGIRAVFWSELNIESNASVQKILAICFSLKNTKNLRCLFRNCISISSNMLFYLRIFIVFLMHLRYHINVINSSATMVCLVSSLVFSEIHKPYLDTQLYPSE